MSTGKFPPPLNLKGNDFWIENSDLLFPDPLPHFEFDFAKSSRYRRNSIPESETGQDENCYRSQEPTACESGSGINSIGTGIFYNYYDK